MRLGTMRFLAILLLCLPAFGQATYKGGKYSGAGNYVTQGQGVTGPGENFYCPAGAGELTEGTPIWGASDSMAQLPTQCINTAMSSTPGGTHVGGGAATTYTPADTTALNNVLGTLQCGDTIVLTAGNTYTGQFIMPALSCDGAHWITVKSSGVSNGLFPGEGVRATPCIMNVSNNAVNGRNVPGYPDYPCASLGTTLSAKIVQPATGNFNALTFASGANHYRFIGIEFAKSPNQNVSSIITLAADVATMGANHVIFDRCLVHGSQWTPSAGTIDESTNGISAKNSQWIAVINSWGYDTYCNSSCIDSHNYAAGSGAYQDGPHKLYNNLMATAGEPIFFGGGGVGPGTPNAANAEIRSNHSFKPLTWMVPINTCANYRDPVTKNLGEFKGLVLGLIEGNVFENNWQGCQSDQNGTAVKFSPSNQNNHQAVTVTFDGSNVVTTTDNFTHHNTSSLASGNPADAANCPPGGCILEAPDPVNTGKVIDYRFCNSANGCDQSGIPNRKCGTGPNAGLACTANGDCPQSYCAPTTTARLTTTVPAASSVSANACVPGDCPGCRNQDITFRLNEIYNVTGGLSVTTVLSSICRDQSAGMKNLSIHDNLIHGVSREMTNGNDPQSDATVVAIANGSLAPSVASFIGLRHNTFAVESSNPVGAGSFANQVDHTDTQYMEGIAITDNVSPAAYSIQRSQGNGSIEGDWREPWIGKYLCGELLPRVLHCRGTRREHRGRQYSKLHVCRASRRDQLPRQFERAVHRHQQCDDCQFHGIPCGCLWWEQWWVLHQGARHNRGA